MKNQPDYKGFALAMFADWPDISGADGFELQEMGLQYGILEPVQVDRPCGDNCACAEYSGAEYRDGELHFYEGEAPIICYRVRGCKQ